MVIRYCSRSPTMALAAVVTMALAAVVTVAVWWDGRRFVAWPVDGNGSPHLSVAKLPG